MLHEVEPDGLQAAAEVRVDDPRRLEQVRVGFDSCLQSRAVLDQIIGGRVNRVEQRQDVLEGAGVFFTVPWVLQGPPDIVEVHPEPGAQPLPETVDLAVARCSCQRHAVQVVHDDLASGRARVGPFPVNLQAGGSHLPQLVEHGVRPAVRGMPELLDLGRQSASPLDPHRQTELALCIQKPCLGEPAPVHGGVLTRVDLLR